MAWKDYAASVTVSDGGRRPFPTTLYFAARSDDEAFKTARRMALRDYRNDVMGVSVTVDSVRETR